MNAAFPYELRGVGACWECMRCGALVLDTLRHDAWHDRAKVTS